MKVSFIIVNYNGRDYIENCIKSILNQDFNKKEFEIIVVDNNSPDESWKLVKKFKKVKLVKLDENVNFAKGNNIGLKYSRGKYIALINNDATIEKDWLKKMVQKIESDEKIGVLGCKIYYGDGMRIWGAGAKNYFPGFIKHLKLESETNVPYVPFAAVLINRETIGDNFLMEKLIMYAEDNEFCQRLMKNGYKVVYYPDAIAHHFVKENRVSKHEEYYLMRNTGYVYSLYFNPILRWIYFVFDLIIFYYVIAVYRILRNPKRLKFWKDYIRARIDSIKLWLGKNG